MKRSTTYLNKGTTVRIDALLLAVLIFIQTITPSFTFAGVRMNPNKKLGGDRLMLNTTKSDLPQKVSVIPTRNVVREMPKVKSGSSLSNIARTMPGGPDQPEAQSFAPVGTDGMVDPFSGDFSYNLPLMEVDGYPINIAYAAGAGMDQEASWVGLGWNLNPGVINRNLRGIPDDFNGVDQITQEYNQKPNWTVGTSVGINYELFSIDLSSIPSDGDGGLTLSANLGVEYNNYTGYGADFSIGPSFNIAKKMGFEVGMQYTGSSQGGATVGMNVALSDGNKKTDRVVNKLSIGSAFNSRQGLQQVSVNLSQERRFNTTNIRKGRTVGHENIGNGLGSSFNFGMSTFVAQIPFETSANSFTARFKLGGDAAGNDPSGSFSGFFSKSSLTSNSRTLPAFGYINLEKGQNNSYAMLDFNRENTAPFTKNTPALPIPLLTYDIYSVSGQGIGGSYRMDRRDIGYVFDPYVTSSSNSFTVGGEVGLGVTFKAGIDVGGVFTNGSSGVWTDGNDAARNIRFNSSTNHFREASELAYDESDAQFQNIAGSRAAYFPLTNTKKLTDKLRTSSGDSYSLSNSKSLSFRRNQPLVSFTVQEVKNGYGPTKLPANAYANIQSGITHHIGAFTVTKTDGSRFYYGLPAYSKTQKNVSFAVGDGKTSGLIPDWNTRLVTYSSQDASVVNNRGLDNHYNAQTIPNYAHSYMLTAVLGTDYIDSDNLPGPSKNDLGAYVEFKYKQIQQYKWRNPVNASQAMHDRGLNTDPTDDKANYIYGEKELWYLDTIKSKNQLLIFYTSDRKDAVSVNDEFGGISASNTKMQKLDSLKLYSRPEFELFGTAAAPIKVVHFEYDYSLCRNYPGNLEAASSDTLKGGKLTLKKVYSTYANSYRGEKESYTFNYGFNPSYNVNNVDRWGTYKPNPGGLTGNEVTSPLSNSEFPYVGYDKQKADLWASAWNLNNINLPSGGRITISYEADDYAYVQHKRAKQMFKIVNVEGCSESKCSISNDGNKNRKLYFEMIPGTSIQDYAIEGEVIYFKALLAMNEDADRFDYVPGYAVIDEIGVEGSYGYLKLKPGKLKDSESSANYNPLAIAGIQFARNYLSRMIPPSSQENPQSEEADFLDIVNSLVGAFTSFGELFTGPNVPLWNKEIGTILVTGKSWLRLNNPNFVKLGGGHRVKEIRTYDAWKQMVSGANESYYGQQYLYNFDGKSSGVASYEPQLGGEENTWRNYVANDIKMTWAPDERNYMETPFGEQFFPSASVGYGKVLIKNISRNNVVKTATGHTISEFYTAKDFPTISERTDVDKKPSRFNLNLLLYSKAENMMAVSQGFVVENNDMHGKPKSVEIFAEGQLSSYSSEKFYYQSSSKVIDDIAANQLTNDVDVITPSGTIKTVVVGRTYEAVADFRENKSRMKSGNLGINLNYTMPFILVPMILGANYTDSKTEFRSAVFAKSIERKGILYKTVAEDYSSKIETENLAYDAETGEVLLTSVNNGFKDTVYSFVYPAHWVYQGMGQAYRNLGFTSTVSKVFNDGYSSGFNSSQLYEGDEVMIVQAGNYIKGWVTETGVQGVRVLTKDGTPIDGTISYLKVIRSGNRNLQNTTVGSVTLMKNPLLTLSGNVFNEVLSAQSVEYGNAWRTFCDCNESTVGNPYVSGLKGNWMPKATYSHLSDRVQTFENNNSNIRKDGLMRSYFPFFRLNNGQWAINKENWTHAVEASQFSPFGQGLENFDALNRYSAIQIGYNQTLPTAVTGNSMRKQSGFDGFEDYMFESCPDNHFKIGSKDNIISTDAHSGKYSLKVSAGNPVIFTRQLAAECEIESLCDFSKYILQTEVKQVYVMESEGIIMTYEVIYGEPAPVMTEVPGGILMTFNSPSAFRVDVKLTRNDGCTAIVPITGL